MERKRQPFADIKGTLDTEKTQRADTAEHIARYVEDRIEEKVNKSKWHLHKALKMDLSMGRW